MTTHAPDAGERIMDHLEANPLPGIELRGMTDFARPDPTDIGGWADDQAADDPAPRYTDAATIHLGIGRLALNADGDSVRWYLEIERYNPATGFESLKPAGEGVLNGDITPVIDAIRAAVADR